MNKTRIDWPGLTHTWNVVTGCRRGCSYCYARRIHKRFHPDVPFEHIVFHPDRLLSRVPPKPTRIFVGSMSDIEYWDRSDTDKILRVCQSNLQHEFLFLSKSPHSYHNIDWPVNCMQGLTITEGNAVAMGRVGSLCTYVPRPFLSVEPLLGPILDDLPEKIELVICGVMTGPGAVPPKTYWIDSVLAHCPTDKLHWKANIKPFLKC
jgi:protein gp37